MEFTKQKRLRLGQTLSKIRDAEGLTQEELSFKSGISLSGIRKIEQGQTWPRFQTVKALADALNESVESLYSTNNIEKPITYNNPLASSIADLVATKLFDNDRVKLASMINMDILQSLASSNEETLNRVRAVLGLSRVNYPSRRSRSKA